MSKVKCRVAVSLDGFVAGPNQSLENPIGVGGLRLHEWAFSTKSFQAMHSDSGAGETGVDDDVIREAFENLGATIMGRNMFGPVRGPWGEEWRGWWGDTPPYRHPVFVLTHYPRAPLPMLGGTTFHFVTDGIESALRQAKAVAGSKDVSIAGGASTIQQYLGAGHLDEIELHVAPVLLGSGERLFDGADPRVKLEPIRSLAGKGVTHLKYRVVK
jgi:dihydrofolate reductase